MSFKDSERPWLLAGALGAVVLPAGAWFTVIGPEFANASTVRGDVADAQTKNILLQANTSKLKAKSQQLPALQQELANKLAQLPTDAQYSQLTAQINQQAAAAGVQLASIGFTTPSVVGSATSSAVAGQTFSVSVTLTANGPIASIQAFLHQLQQVGPRAALISTVTFSAAAKNYTMSATMTAFTTPLTPSQSDELQSELTAVAPSN